MKVYHGTSAEYVDSILAEGILPRGDKGSNWDISSGHDRVYVSTVYAPYFSMRANPDGECAIVEVDLGKVPKKYLLPDEDWCEQVHRRGGLSATQMVRDLGSDIASMRVRTEWFRDHIDLFAHQAFASLRDLGNLCVRGGISVEAITRISVFNTQDNELMSFASLDPAITLMNHKLMFDKYKALTEWFMGAPVTVDWAKRYNTVAGTCVGMTMTHILGQMPVYSRRHIRILWP